MAALLGTGAYLYWREAAKPGQDQAASPAPVAAARVESGDVPIELVELGQVSASIAVTVRTQVAGQIQRIAFRDGQDVKAGDVLLQIDPRSLQATVDQDKGNLDKDNANLANAEADLKRFAALVGKGVVSEQQAATQRALVMQLRGTVQADMAQLDRDRVQLGYATIRAPVGGVLGLRLVDVGNIVSPGDANGLVVLTQIQPINVLFPVRQSDLQRVQDRQAAGADGLAAEAWTADGARKLDEGRLQALSNQVDAASGTVMLKAVFPNRQRLLWPNAAVSAHLVLDVQKEGLTVPAAAIDQGPKGPFTWVIDANDAVHPVQVGVRQIVNGRALVGSGLQAGQQVVTDGQYGLAEGARVAVQPVRQASAAGNNGPQLRSNGANRLGIAP